jgi:hypothetical protein
VKPRICIADTKEHIRNFIIDVLEDDGLVAGQYRSSCGSIGAAICWCFRSEAEH